MLKKLFRGLVTMFGAIFGYAVCALIKYAMNSTGQNVDRMFTDTQQIGIAVVFAIIFALLFFKLAPSFGRQGSKVASNIEHDLQDVSGHHLPVLADPLLEQLHPIIPFAVIAAQPIETSVAKFSSFVICLEGESRAA